MIKRSFIGYLMILNISVFNSQHHDLIRDCRLHFARLSQTMLQHEMNSKVVKQHVNI